MPDLKPCPCGKAPERLHVVEGESFRYRHVYADCGCGWETEVRVSTMKPMTSDAIYAECAEAWNELPRGENHD